MKRKQVLAALFAAAVIGAPSWGTTVKADEVIVQEVVMEESAYENASVESEATAVASGDITEEKSADNDAEKTKESAEAAESAETAEENAEAVENEEAAESAVENAEAVENEESAESAEAAEKAEASENAETAASAENSKESENQEEVTDANDEETEEVSESGAETSESGAETSESGAAELSVYDQLKSDLAIVVDTEGQSSASLLAQGQKYETGDGCVRFYAKAMAYYEAALNAAEEGSEDAANAQAAIDALNAYKDAVNAEGVQGTVFTLYREGVTASQSGDYETTFCRYYDDAFFFEEAENRGIGGLGDLYRDGTGIEKNTARAVSIYTYCADELGKGNGYTALGLMYEAETGTYDGIEKSLDTAMKYFLWSFDTSKCSSTDFKGPRYAGVLCDSGYYHDNGDWEAPCYQLAEEYFKVAVQGNGRTFDGTAAVYLGQYYSEGRSCTHEDGTVHVIEADKEKAVAYYEKAISDKNVHSTMLGIPKAYLVLGECYETGDGCTADKDTALSYYEKASAAADDNLALTNKGSSDAEMEEIKQEAEAGIARLNTQTEEEKKDDQEETPDTEEEKEPEESAGSGKTDDEKTADEKADAEEQTSSVKGNTVSSETTGTAATVKTGDTPSLFTWAVLELGALAAALSLALRKFRS